MFAQFSVSMIGRRKIKKNDKQKSNNSTVSGRKDNSMRRLQMAIVLKRNFNTYFIYDKFIFAKDLGKNFGSFPLYALPSHNSVQFVKNGIHEAYCIRKSVVTGV